MAPVPTTQMIGVDALVPLDEARISSIGQVILLEPRPGFEARVEARVLGRHAHHECWRRGELPGRWHYGTHPRVPAIVCQMDEGWDALLPRMVEARRAGGTRGSHGYDPALPSMRAVFIAAGPAFPRGAVVAPVDNVAVRPPRPADRHGRRLAACYWRWPRSTCPPWCSSSAPTTPSSPRTKTSSMPNAAASKRSGPEASSANSPCPVAWACRPPSRARTVR